jgi:hypothetical protein
VHDANGSKLVVCATGPAGQTLVRSWWRPALASRMPSRHPRLAGVRGRAAAAGRMAPSSAAGLGSPWRPASRWASASVCYPRLASLHGDGCRLRMLERFPGGVLHESFDGVGAGRRGGRPGEGLVQGLPRREVLPRP